MDSGWLAVYQFCGACDPVPGEACETFRQDSTAVRLGTVAEEEEKPCMAVGAGKQVLLRNFHQHKGEPLLTASSMGGSEAKGPGVPSV